MKSHFELFDLVSGNVLDIYDRESEAIDALIELSLDSGVGTIARFALTQECNGDSQLVAMGDDLVRLVEAKERNRIPVEHSTISRKL